MKNKFLGWYYRIVNKETSTNLVIIIGISNDPKNPHAFIQVFDNISKKPVYIKYPAEDFKLCTDPFAVVIKDSYFSLDKVSLNIQTEEINLVGKVEFKDRVPCKYDIMGPFAKVKYLPCRHGLFTLHSTNDGYIYINKEKISFTGGTTYIEGDSGTSFPEKYIWAQSNKIQNGVYKGMKTNLVFAIAKIPICKKINIRGFFLNLLLKDQQYIFATYSGAKIKDLWIKKVKGGTLVDLKIKQKEYILKIRIRSEKGHTFVYPEDGQMLKNILEADNSNIILAIYKEKKVVGNRRNIETKKIDLVFMGKYTNAATEIKIK
ncbi:MAG: hypothetical protein RR664_05160 [Clostridia bacterium]